VVPVENDTRGRAGEAKLSGLTRIERAIRVSFRALWWGVREEEAVRVAVFMLAVFVPLGLWLGQSGIERALLVGVLLVAFVVEILNTAVEVVVDRIGLEHHDLSGLAKDLGSAAVMIALLLTIIVWLLILWGRLPGR
jgi:diacylglycerol kinase (ATP)